MSKEDFRKIYFSTVPDYIKAEIQAITIKPSELKAIPASPLNSIKRPKKDKGTTMSNAFDRNGHPVKPGDLVTVHNVPALPEYEGHTCRLLEVGSGNRNGSFGFENEYGDVSYTNEVQYVERPEAVDRNGFPVTVGDRVRVYNVPGLARLNGTVRELTEVGAVSRHGQFRFKTDDGAQVYTNEVEVLFDSEDTTPTTGGRLMDKMTFAHELLTYLADERSSEVYVADPDGDVFELRKILFNPENGRIYLIRDYDSEVAPDHYIPEHV
jgi:hypothetical protein